MKRFVYRLLIVLKQTYRDMINNYYHAKYHSENTNEIKYAMLRTYCHMLDKGMNNIHFEKGHSLRFLKSAQELREELFPIYRNDRCFAWIDKILEKFKQSQIDGQPTLNNRVPIDYSEQQIKEYSSFMFNRTSCRNFKDQRIPSNILKEIINIAIDAPNGCCRQVVRYYLTQDKEKIKEIIPHVAGITNFSNIQCLVCVAAETSYYDLKDKNLQYVDASLSAENFILGASLYGVYGTMCNFFQATVEDKAFCREIYGISKSENIVLFIAMGYPINIPMKPVRRDVEVFYKEV